MTLKQYLDEQIDAVPNSILATMRKQYDRETVNHYLGLCITVALTNVMLDEVSYFVTSAEEFMLDLEDKYYILSFENQLLKLQNKALRLMLRIRNGKSYGMYEINCTEILRNQYFELYIELLKSIRNIDVNTAEE